MADPLVFAAHTPRHALPLLFAAQAQKEVVVNEALVRLDALAHLTVAGEIVAPPNDPGEGEAWLIAAGATGPWAAREGQLAVFSAGDWLYLAPSDGLRCWHAADQLWLLYNNGWQRPQAPTLPNGGQVIDSESRETLAQIVNALTTAGIFPA